MALQYSPKISTDGLVLCLDPGNNKSLPSYTLPVKGGLVMWMDAADDSTFTYSSGTTVSQWRDKSGSGYHMVPVSAGPTRNSFLNSRKTITITNAQQIGNLSINLSTSPNTVFVVSRLTGGANGRVLTAYYNNWLLGHWGGYVNQYYAEGWIAYAVNAADTTWRIYMGDWGGSTNDTADAFSNGSSIRNSPAGDAAAGPSGLVINSQGWEQSNCEAAEIIVFNRLLTVKERKQVHTYLGLKWGISNVDRSIQDLVFNNDSKLGEGTVANMPRFDYYNGGALALDGVNDYFYLNEGSAVPYFNPDGSTVTVSLWFKASSISTGGANKMIFSDNCSPEFSLHQVDSTVYAYSYTGVAATIQANTWYNACWTSNAGAPSSATTTTVTFYLNGSLVGTASTSTGNGLNDTPLTIGKDPCVAGTNWSGSIGPIHLYNRILTAKEIKQNYDMLNTRFFQTIVQGGLTGNFDAGNPYSYAGAGTVWYDVSGNNYTGSLTNGPTYSNQTILFDGTNDFIDLTTTNVAVSGNGARSIFVWMRTTAGGLIGFVGTGTPANSQAFNLVKYSSGVGVMGYNNDFYPGAGAAGVTLNDGNWHYIGATFDGTNLRTYADGVLDNTSGAITYSTTGQNNFIGKSNHTGNENYFNGNMGLVQFYNRALSGAEVLQNYNATKGRYGR
jgi:hypothetical protein